MNGGRVMFNVLAIAVLALLTAFITIWISLFIVLIGIVSTLVHGKKSSVVVHVTMKDGASFTGVADSDDWQVLKAFVTS